MLPTTPAEPDGAGHDSRHVPVHGAGATRRRGGRRAHRHLRVRRGAVRDGHREEGVRGQEPGGPHRRHPRTRPCAGLHDPADVAAPRSIASFSGAWRRIPTSDGRSAGDLAVQLKWIDATASASSPASHTCEGSDHGESITRVDRCRCGDGAGQQRGLGVAVIYFSRAIGVEPVLQFQRASTREDIFDSGQFRLRSDRVAGRDRLAFTARDASGTIQIWVRPLDTLTSQLSAGNRGCLVSVLVTGRPLHRLLREGGAQEDRH